MPDSGFLVNNMLGNFEPPPPSAPPSAQPVQRQPAPPPVMKSGLQAPDQPQQLSASPAADLSAPAAPTQAPNAGGPGAAAPAAAQAPPDIAPLVSVIYQREGSGDTDISPKGAVGKGQVMPGTAAQYLAPGADPKDPEVQRRMTKLLLDPQVNAKVTQAYVQDLHRRYPHDPQAVLVAYNAGPDVADKWLAAGKDPSVLPAETQRYIGPTLSDQWGQLTPQERQLMQERTNATDATMQGLTTMAQNYMREAAQAPAGSKERDSLIAQYRKNLDQMQDEWRKKVATPPVEQPIDAMKNFGSATTVLALLGGLLSRRHLTAGLNAAAASMNAINTNNHERFEKEYQTWKTQTELGLHMIDMENQDIRSLVEDKRMSIDEKNARLQTMVAEMGFAKEIGGMQMNNIDTGIAFMEKRQALAAQAQNHADMLQFHHDNMQQMHQDRMAALAARVSGASLSQYGDPPEGKSDNPNKPTQGSNIPQSIWAGATQYALTGHMPVLGNSAAGRAAIQSALPWVLEARGMTDADMTRQSVLFRGALAGAGTLGARLANLNVGLSELPHLGDQLLKVSADTPRTDFLPFNRLLQAYELNTGDPQIVKLGGAMNSFMQGYARAINPSGVITDDIRGHVDRVMNQAMADGQIKGGVDQLNQEAVAMKEGLMDAAAMGGDMFPLPGEAKQERGSSGTTEPAPPGVPEGSKKIGTKNGNPVYQAPDGSRFMVH